MQHATSGRWQVPPLKRQFDALDARVAAITTDSDGVRREWGAKVEALYALVVDQGRSHADAKRLLSSQLESAGAVNRAISALLCAALLLCSARARHCVRWDVSPPPLWSFGRSDGLSGSLAGLRRSLAQTCAATGEHFRDVSHKTTENIVRIGELSAKVAYSSSL